MAHESLPDNRKLSDYEGKFYARQMGLFGCVFFATQKKRSLEARTNCFL